MQQTFCSLFIFVVSLTCTFVPLRSHAGLGTLFVKTTYPQKLK